MKRYLTLLFLILLAGRLFGQQEQASDLDSLLAAAKQAQAASHYADAAGNYRQAVRLRPDIPELHANLGLMEHESGNYVEAIRSFQEALRLNPSLYVPNLFLGIDYVRAGYVGKAIPLLLKAEKMKATDPLPSLTLGHAYSLLGKYDLAVLEFGRTLQLDQKQSAGWFDLGIAHLKVVEADSRTMAGTYADTSYARALYAESLVKQSRYKEAAELYKNILASGDRPPCMRSAAAFLSLKQGDTENADLQFTTERSEHPECTLALLGEARLRIDAGASASALQLIQQVWARDHGFFVANTSRLFDAVSSEHLLSFSNALAQQQSSGSIDPELYAALTQPTEEAPDARNVAESGKNTAIPRSAQSYRVQGQNDYVAGHYELCASVLKSSLESWDASALQPLAACSFFTGDYALTSSASRALLSLPSYPQAQALYWSISANEKLAFASLARFEQLEPGSPRSHILLGDIYRQRQRYDDAQKEYIEALNLSPDNTAALLGLAAAYFGDSNLEKTVEFAQKALLHSPDDPEINMLLGEALVSQHKFTDAEPVLLKALRAQPQVLSHVHALLGEAYAADGKTEDAVRELKLGAQSDQDGSLHYRLARLYSKMGDNADAAIEIQQMKALQQRRREGAVIAVQDSHATAPDDNP